MTQAVLLIEDEPILAKNIAIYLERHGCEVRIAETAEEGLALLEHFKPDAVVLDFNLPGMDGYEALQRLLAIDATLPVVMVTGHGNVELAVEAMKAGAREFLTKPVSLAKLKLLLDKAMQTARRDQALSYYQQRDGVALNGLIGESPAMRALGATLQQLIAAEAQMQQVTPPAVLVLGETGTGKEVVARALHFEGQRRHRPFVELNCAALPPQLLESELFGHERGAFTGANERKLGLVETAEGGTLFLDEIGDMDLALQAKLLKLLEERTVRRVGGLREMTVDVRVIAATHRPLEVLVQQGRFRADLYFRLCVVRLPIPPLRQRGDDVLRLATHFIAELAQRYGRAAPTLCVSAQDKLLQHDWPGNVRELRNVLEQTVLLCPGPQVEAQHLALVPMTAASVVESGFGGLDGLSAPMPLGGSVSTGRATGGRSGVGGFLPSSEVDPEREALIAALERCNWNVSRTAQALEITRDALRYRIEKHGLQRQMSFTRREG